MRSTEDIRGRDIPPQEVEVLVFQMDITMTEKEDMIKEEIIQKEKEGDLVLTEMEKEGEGPSQDQEIMTIGACHNCPFHPFQDPTCPPPPPPLLPDMMGAGPVWPAAAAAA